MIAASAALCAAVGFAVESSNIVGYQQLNTDAKLSPSMGATFVPVSGAASYKLGDVVAKDMDPDTDCLQVLDPDTTAATALYSYFSKELADALAEEDGEPEGAYDELIGWWDMGKAGEPENYRSNTSITVGQGFLGLFMSAEDVTFTYNGSVPMTSTSLSTGAKLSPTLCNYLPIQVTLSQLTADGMDPDTDCLQVLDPTSTAATALYSYFSKELADELAEEDGEPEGAYDELIGWWDMGKAGEPENYRGGVTVAPGAAFLGLFMSSTGSGEAIQFNFPAAASK